MLGVLALFSSSQLVVSRLIQCLLLSLLLLLFTDWNETVIILCRALFSSLLKQCFCCRKCYYFVFYNRSHCAVCWLISVVVSCFLTH